MIEEVVMHAYSKIKNILKTYIPNTYYWLINYKEQLIDNKNINAIFKKAYHGKIWNIGESLSGPGSTLDQTEVIVRELPKLIQSINVKTLIDAPCGDFYWMNQLAVDFEEYIGVDIVPELISDNIIKYQNNTRKFIIANIVKDPLPKVDIILNRDCLVHFNTFSILKTIKNFKKSKSIYLLTTTFPETIANRDIRTGSWQPLNLQLPPFNFPEPLKLINEKCTLMDGKYGDKSLGLWKLADL
jgi:hypothetical protein